MNTGPSETIANSPGSVPQLPHEAERLNALHSYHVLDTVAEKDFDDLTTLASVICHTPIALVSLVDKDRQWFKSRKGLPIAETAKEHSFCAHAIASPEPIMIVGDAANDSRFASNPLVTGDPHIVFYAGVPLINKEGYELGSLCVIDTETRQLTADQVNALKIVASQVMDKLELRRKVDQLETANRLLIESENRFRDLVSQAPVAIAIYGREHLIIEQANAAMLQLWGQTEEVVGKPLLEARPEITGDPFVDRLQGIFESGNEETGYAVKAIVTENGLTEDRYFNARYKPVKSNNGEVSEVIVVATEVTKEYLHGQREAEMKKELTLANEELRHSRDELTETVANLANVNEELAATNEVLDLSQKELEALVANLNTAEARLRYLLDDAPVAIAVMAGRNLVIEAANKRVLEIWGKTGSVLGMPLTMALPELEGQQFLKWLDDVYNTGTPFVGNEIKASLKQNGQLEDVFLNFVYHPLKNQDNEVDSIMLIATVVTEQVEAKQALRDFNERLQMAFEAGSLGATEVDWATGIMNSTEQFKNNYGRTADEDFNYPDLFESMLPQYRADIKKLVTSAIENKTIYRGEYEVQWPDGSVHWISAHGKPKFDTDGNIVKMIGLNSDITKQVMARKELESAEHKFRLITDNIAQLAWMADQTGDIFWYNRRWFDYTGTSLEEMQGWGWQKVHHPNHIDRVVKKLKHHFNTGEIWEDTFPIRGADGEYRWFLSKAVPTKDEQGQIVSWLGTNTDITVQHRLEQQKDEFISIASHELKTPVTSLKASLQLLDRMKDKPFTHMHTRLIEQSYRSMEKMGALIDDLLNSNSITEGQLSINKTTFTVAEMLNGCCSHVRIAGKYDLIVEGEKHLQIHADEQRIDQVIVNLVNNAVKYAPDSKDIYLTVERLGNNAKISVTDSGPGISPQQLPYLFDRYYRVSHEGKLYTGLGLGLYISSEIIKKHGGEIGVTSELGTGSTFWFTLPI
ncbi:hypothetical protein A0256_01875 [Mucilaginibacter sp. PAMC 26640]|nr:hypothetical protein A0256_01875 [Mucilaginibacter sp. PAMC 26640]